MLQAAIRLTVKAASYARVKVARNLRNANFVITAGREQENSIAVNPLPKEVARCAPKCVGSHFLERLAATGYLQR